MSGAPPDWPALAAAAQRRVPRLPFVIDGIEVGSVAVEHLGALQAFAPRPLRIEPARVRLDVPAAARDAALADIHQRLRAQGLIKAWRDETYPLPDPASGRVLAHIERAASRFWGTLTFGAHANGWVAGADGRPARLWIAQRAFDKATDPGAFDNLVGGGVPADQSPFETLLREGWEEAGLAAAVMRRASAGRVVRLLRDIPEGLQHERLHVYDLRLDAAETPVNQDGEVHAFRCLPIAEALALAAGATMTVDAALVTLDFALRHRLLADDAAAALAARSAALWAPATA
ncbi:MAG: DUF4743 domain-containing protein [Proteobacteria bacterium]|nr:DUF4743 domain-containing protein [Pseudomonadota bacterium]